MEKTAKREKKRIVAIGRVFVGITKKDERYITISRNPQDNNYYVDVDGVNNYVGKTLPEWAKFSEDDGIYNHNEYKRLYV